MARGVAAGRIFPAEKLLALWPEGTHAGLIAESLGVGRGTVQRWRSGGTNFTDIEADMYACRIGLHPSNIWSNWA